MLLLRTIFWISYLFLYLLCCLPAYFKEKRLLREGKNEEYDRILTRVVGNWATKLLQHLKIRVEVEGRENLPGPEETVVYAANHQSFLDIPILLSSLDKPHGLIAKKELGKIPLLRGWMNLLGCVYVDRDDVRNSIAALKAAENTVKGGKSFIVFPEGTRTKDGSLSEFKAGAVRIASKAKAPVIPVVIDGSFRLLEEGGFRLRKGTVKLTILPAIPTEGLTREQQKELPERLQAMVAAGLEQSSGAGQASGQ